MEMIDGARLNLFSDTVVPTGHHVDVLPVSGLWLVENFDDEKLHGTMKVLLC
jgi:hypothetical protein